jgi:hypothetical protein
VAESILTNTKKILGIDESYTAFDVDIITHINSVFATLNQLGIGPEDGFSIVDDAATWEDYLGTNLKYSSVKTYMYLAVRLYFDPPTTSYAADAMKEQKRELEWRLNVVREETAWVDPYGEELGDELVLDGGSP